MKWYHLLTLLTITVIIAACAAPGISTPSQPTATIPTRVPVPTVSLGPTSTREAEHSPLTKCMGFEELTVGSIYKVPSTFTDSGTTVVVLPFQWSNGTWTSTGPGAMVRDAKDAGGSGKEVFINNVNLGFAVGDLRCVTLRFRDMGGNVNLAVNNVTGNYPDFTNGMLSGVTIAVTSDARGAILTLRGKFQRFVFQNQSPINFAIGGQELPIDDVCPCE